MVEYKIKLEGSDGKPYVITYGGLWAAFKREAMTYEERMGWTDATRKLREDVNRLSDLVLSEILVPKAREAVLAFLKENPNVETRSFYHKAWQHRERSYAWEKAKEELEAEGRIISKSHGRHQNRTWKLKEE